MDKHLDGSWEDFEAGLKETIGSDFRWCVRPPDTLENREMVADLVLKDIERCGGVFPKKNAFIERV